MHDTVHIRPYSITVHTAILVPSAAPDPIPPTFDEVGKRSALLSWSIPSNWGRNGIITHYRVELSMNDGFGFRIVRNITVSVQDPSFDGPFITSHLVTDLTPFTGYSFRVAAVNDAGVGRFAGRIISFKTDPDCE